MTSLLGRAGPCVGAYTRARPVSTEPQRREAGTGQVHRFTAGPALRGERLDRAVASSLRELSRSRVQALLDAGRVRSTGAPGRAALRLKGGETLEVSVPPPEPAVPEPEDLPSPSSTRTGTSSSSTSPRGSSFIPSAGHARGTLVNALLHHVSGLSGVGGVLRPGIVHRLDKETSGCLVVAKNDAALQALQRGVPGAHGGEDLPRAGARPSARDGTAGDAPRPPPERSKALHRPREDREARGHHLARAHACSMAPRCSRSGWRPGAPTRSASTSPSSDTRCSADALYGGTRKGDARVKAVQTRLGRQGLHAWRLVFPHPRTGRPVRCEAPVPADLSEASEALSKP